MVQNDMCSVALKSNDYVCFYVGTSRIPWQIRIQKLFLGVLTDDRRSITPETFTIDMNNENILLGFEFLYLH